MSLSTPIAQRIRWGTADAAAERIRWIAAGAATLALALVPATPALAKGKPDKAGKPGGKSLEWIAAEQPSRNVTMLVQLREDVTLAQGAELAESLDGRVKEGLPAMHGLAVKMDAEDAVRLDDSALVHAATMNAPMAPQAVGTTRDIVTTFPFAIQAKEAWTKDEAGVSGAGVGVAVIDTGIAGGLADFRVSETDARSRVVASVVANPGASSAADVVGHGTHVAGVIAGNGNHRTDRLRGEYIGIAPDAKLVSVNVADDAGDATTLDVIRGLDFVIQHGATLGIRVVNLSLSSTLPGSYRTDPLDAAVESAWKKGIVVVTAAGNRGSGAGTVDYAPGNDPFAITVGGTDDRGTNSLGDDFVADWSSRGTTADGFAKPEVYAPGARIVAPLAPDSMFKLLCPACILGNGYIRASGTSMSAPVVSGAAALLLEKYPQLTPDQVKGTLLQYTRPAPGGANVVSPFAAIKGVRDSGPVAANQGLVPNEAVDAVTGDVDETRSRWSRSRWSTAEGDLSAGFARSSWSCADCGDSSGESVDETRSSWSRSSWSSLQD